MNMKARLAELRAKKAGGEADIVKRGQDYVKALIHLGETAQLLKQQFSIHPVDPAADDRGRGKAADEQIAKVIRFVFDIQQKDPLLMEVYIHSPMYRK